MTATAEPSPLTDAAPGVWLGAAASPLPLGLPPELPPEAGGAALLEPLALPEELETWTPVAFLQLAS